MRQLIKIGSVNKTLLEFSNNIQLMNYLIENEIQDWYDRDTYRVSFGNVACTIGLGEYLHSFGLCDDNHSKLLKPKYRSVFGNKEYILCSAIMYNGHMLTGYRHSSIFDTLDFFLGKDNYEKPENRGFLTSKNRFVDRVEGYKIARANNQLSLEHCEGTDETLISENLYIYEENGMMR